MKKKYFEIFPGDNGLMTLIVECTAKNKRLTIYHYAKVPNETEYHCMWVVVR